ncbi:DUF1671-domain-containing protein [Xylariaceae sp. AK1471]|nr:DUF1671-domain-containing protein [Xylariaceae sp. AK1471]
MEELHAEEQSPFVADPDLDVSEDKEGHAPQQEANSDDEDKYFVECPVDGCLEQITLAKLEGHIDFHEMEEYEEHIIPAAAVAPSPGDSREYQSPYSYREDVHRSSREHGRERARSPKTHGSVVKAWKKLLDGQQARKPNNLESESASGHKPRKRLGRTELGKHAYEHQMPEWLVKLLKKEKYSSAEGIIPVLARLLERSSGTEYAYLCHPAVQHISKLRREGSFCGYRNIQMLVSYVVGARVEGTERFGDSIPSIFQIQDYVENAWDMGINASGRVETGGIKGTRKYIGTPEAQAMFLALDIPCDAEGFRSSKEGVSEALLFASVLQYFESAPFDPKNKVRCTDLPPIYFQHQGHSMTIVGLERRASGALELLVFDPMFHGPTGIKLLIELLGRGGSAANGSAKDNKKTSLNRNPDRALKMYRRGHKYLRRYNEFEILKLIKATPDETIDSSAYTAEAEISSPVLAPSET